MSQLAGTVKIQCDIAEALYGCVPEPIAQKVRGLLPEEFVEVMDRFRTRFVKADALPP